MKKNKIRMIILCIFLVILASVIYFPLTLSTKGKSTVLDKVNIVNVSIDESDGIYNYSSTLIATDDIFIDKLNIILKDSAGNTVDELIGYVQKNLKKDEEYKIISSTDTDLSIVKDIEYTLK